MSDSTIIPDGYKQCNVCQSIKPAAKEYFRQRKSGHFYNQCRDCEHEYLINYRSTHRDKTRRQARERYHSNIVVEREKGRLRAARNRNANPDKYRSINRKSYYKLREKNIKGLRDYYYRTVETRRAYARFYYQNHKAVRDAYNRSYRIANRQELNQQHGKYIKSYRKTPHGYAVTKAATHRYNARKRSLLNTLTADEWKQALDYFGGRCAVCGRPPKDLFSTHTIAADHWIPVSKGGGTTADNILPLCHGLDGCNNSKLNKDPETWLIERLGKRKAKKMLAEIEAYFAWVRTRQA